MFSTVVVGIDGSETAAVVAERAIELARQNGAALHLVNAYPGVVGLVADPIGGTGAAEISNAVLREASETLLNEKAARCEDLSVQAHSVREAPAEAVIGVAEAVDADLIVIGSKGMKRRIIGSIPNTVAHKAPCSVLIVKTV